MEFISKTFDELTNSELYEILKSRNEVFLLEQKIICQDLDNVDYKSRHCYIFENGRVAAYLRAFYIDKNTVRIGRVLTISHGKGMGRELMDKSIKVIIEKMPCLKIYIEAQKYAVGFYEKHGFVVTSGEFLDEGIVHVAMEKNILS